MVTASRRHIKSWVVPKFDYRDASLQLYLPLWYQYSDMTGTTIYSYDRNRLACTVTGALWNNLGVPGRFFDTIDDVIDLSDVAALQPTAQIALCSWIKPNQTAAVGRIMSRASGDPYKGWSMYHSTVIGFQLYVDGTLRDKGSGGTPISANNWYFVVCQYDGAKMSIYINAGADLLNFAVTGAIGYDARTPKIGHSDGITDSQPFGGNIGECWIYNRGLTVAEIAQSYQNTKWRYT